MPGVPEPGADPRQRLEPCVVVDRVELLDARYRIGHPVDRLDEGTVAPRVALVELLDLHLLDVGGIGQHHRGEVGGRRRRVDRAAEPVPGQLGQEPGMVDMGVAEDHRPDLARREGERPVVQLLLGLGTLEQPAIDQQLAMVGLEPVAGPGDAARGAMEGQAEHGQRTPRLARVAWIPVVWSRAGCDIDPAPRSNRPCVGWLDSGTKTRQMVAMHNACGWS